MALLIPYDLGGIDPKVRTALDPIIAAIQVWAGKVDGINAEARINELATGLSSVSTVQTGTIHAYGGSSAPSGYLPCDGSAVSRSTYAALFAVLGTTYGAGNGSTTFNLPDTRGRFILGVAASGTGSTLGATGGSIDHVHTGPSHTHSGGTISGSTGSAAPGLSGETGNQTALTGTSTKNDDQEAYTVDPGTTQNVVRRLGTSIDPPTTGGHSHTINNHHHSVGTLAVDSHAHSAGTLAVGTSGAGGTGNTGSANPPFIAMRYIIKT